MATASCGVCSVEGLSFGLVQGVRGLIWGVLEFFFSLVLLLRVVVLRAAAFVAKGLPEGSHACSLRCQFSCSCCSCHCLQQASRAGKDEDFQSANPHWQVREDELLSSNYFKHRAGSASPKVANVSQSCASESGGAGSSGNNDGQQSEEGDKWECIRGLQQELEEERIAAELAAKAALGQIGRLHHEKAAIQMELRQYRRMSEERFQHDAARVELLQQQLARAEDFAAALGKRFPSDEDNRLGLQRATQTPRVALARLESSLSSGAFQIAADMAEGTCGRSTRRGLWRESNLKMAGVLSEAALESSSATNAAQSESCNSSLALLPGTCRAKGMVKQRKGEPGQILGNKLFHHSENAGAIRRTSSEGCISAEENSGRVSRPALPGGAMRRRPLRALSTQLPAEQDKRISAEFQALPEKGTSQIESLQHDGFKCQTTIRPATQGRGLLLKGLEEHCEQEDERTGKEQLQDWLATSQDASSRTEEIRIAQADDESGKGVKEAASPSSPQRPAEAMELKAGDMELPVVCERCVTSPEGPGDSEEEAHLQLCCADRTGGDTAGVTGTLQRTADLIEGIVPPGDTGSQLKGTESQEVEECGDKKAVQTGERPLVVVADSREKDVGSPKGHQELVQKLLKWQRRASLGEVVALSAQEQKNRTAASEAGQSGMLVKQDEEGKRHLNGLPNTRQAPAGAELEPLAVGKSGGNRVQDMVQQLTKPHTSASDSGRCKTAGAAAQLQERFLSRLRQAGAENELEAKLARRRQREADVGAADSAQKTGPDWPKVSQVLALGPVEEELGVKLARRRHWEGSGRVDEGIAQGRGLHDGASKGGVSPSEGDEMSFRTPATAPYAEQAQSGGFVTPSSLAWNQNTPVRPSPDSSSPPTAMKTALCKMSELVFAEMSSEGSSPGGGLVHPWPGTPPPAKALEGGFEATPNCTWKAPALDPPPASNSSEKLLEERSSGEGLEEGMRGWSDVDRKLEELDGCVKGLEARQD